MVARGHVIDGHDMQGIQRMLHVPLIDDRDNASPDGNEITVRNIKTTSVGYVDRKWLKRRPEPVADMLEV